MYHVKSAVHENSANGTVLLHEEKISLRNIRKIPKTTRLGYYTKPSRRNRLNFFSCR